MEQLRVIGTFLWAACLFYSAANGIKIHVIKKTQSIEQTSGWALAFPDLPTDS